MTNMLFQETITNENKNVVIEIFTTVLKRWLPHVPMTQPENGQ